MGNIVDTLMPPLSAGELLVGYLAGGISRGIFVGVPILLLMMIGLGMSVAHPIWLLIFVVIGSALLGALGLMAAILANKFDQLAAITNFVITPLSFLSGTFYSIHAVPQGMQVILRVNPIFYLIDGVRYGVLGVSDSSPWLGLVVSALSTGAVCFLVWRWLRLGYRLKS
ncbi:MAG: ABC transporter permease [Pseudomonadota bacterium]